VAVPQNLQKTGDFVQLMIGCQSRLYAFIMSLVCDPDQAADVLQQTNLVMWEKSDQFTPGTNFSAWAYQIARYQVMAQRQKRRRDRLVFDDETIAAVADVFTERADEDDRLTALAHCLNQLDGDARSLIRTRYADGLSVHELAGRLGHTANRVAVRLHRLRLALMRCIERKMLQEAVH
jgi:RNA polymerase sigma-70 factor (ECF subfamily)